MMWSFPESWGYPQIIHFGLGFSIINHPAVGYPHLWNPANITHLGAQTNTRQKRSGKFRWSPRIFIWSGNVLQIDAGNHRSFGIPTFRDGATSHLGASGCPHWKIIPIFPHSSWLLLHELKLIDLNGPVSFVVGQITVKMSAFQRDFHGFNARLHLHLTGWTALHLAAAHGLEEVKWSCQRRSAGRICQMGSLHISE